MGCLMCTGDPNVSIDFVILKILVDFFLDLSHKGTPTRCMMSEMRAVFIFLSRGDAELSEGHTLASKTHGLRS